MLPTTNLLALEILLLVLSLALTSFFWKFPTVWLHWHGTWAAEWPWPTRAALTPPEPSSRTLWEPNRKETEVDSGLYLVINFNLCQGFILFQCINQCQNTRPSDEVRFYIQTLQCFVHFQHICKCLRGQKKGISDNAWEFQGKTGYLQNTARKK